ncbi:MAG: hypothetical protein QNK84_00480 [Flavobacteriales bacterium]|tara:strand:+ start:149 stop:307 length:159 start_codon:yes stop_codon:yes gene_type:complete
MRMNKIDIITIIVIAGALVLLNEFSLLEQFSKFAIVPLIGMYFFGKYIAKKY